METEDLRKELITGLKNTVAEKVHLDAGQVIQAIGPAKAEELAFYVTEMQQAPMTKNKPRSAIQQDKVVVRSGMAGFNRLALLKELEGAQPAQDISSTRQNNTSKVDASSQRHNSASAKNSADPATGS